MTDLQRKGEKSPLWKHAEEYHEGQWFDIEVLVTDRNFGKPSRRMITEAVRINGLDDDKAMNGKCEWTYMRLDKVQVSR